MGWRERGEQRCASPGMMTAEVSDSSCGGRGLAVPGEAPAAPTETAVKTRTPHDLNLPLCSIALRLNSELYGRQWVQTTRIADRVSSFIHTNLPWICEAVSRGLIGGEG